MPSKKDYVQMAAMIKEMTAQIDTPAHDADGTPIFTDPYTKGFTAGRRSTLRIMAEHMCDTYVRDNPRFDRAKFIEACGFVV